MKVTAWENVDVEVQVDVNYKYNFETDYWQGILDAQGKSDGKYY